MANDYSKKYRCVYALVDPRTDKPFYVGQTCDPGLRIEEHLIEAENALEKEEGERSAKTKLIHELWDGKLEFVVRLLHEGEYTYREICDLENEEIRKAHKEGAVLTNADLKIRKLIHE